MLVINARRKSVEFFNALWLRATGGFFHSVSERHFAKVFKNMLAKLCGQPVVCSAFWAGAIDTP
jgi:hypothetical protein